LVDSCVAAAAREAGSAAEEAAIRKSAKYSNIQTHHIFQPIAVESLCPINASGHVFLSNLGRKLVDLSVNDREISFLFHRLPVLIQRYNAIGRGSDAKRLMSYSNLVFLHVYFSSPVPHSFRPSVLHDSFVKEEE